MYIEIQLIVLMIIQIIQLNLVYKFDYMMVLNMKVKSILITFLMDKDIRNGKMEILLKVILFKERKMVLVNLLKEETMYIEVILKKTK